MNKKIYSPEELDLIEKSDLNSIVLDLQLRIKELEKFFEKIIKEKRGQKIKNKGGSITTEDKEMIKLFNENEKLRRKLEEQIKINNNNKIFLQSQERVIEKLSAQNFLNNKSNKIGTNLMTIQNNLNNPNSCRPESGFSNALTSPTNIITARTQSAKNKRIRPLTGMHNNSRLNNASPESRPATAQNFQK